MSVINGLDMLACVLMIAMFVYRDALLGRNQEG